MVIAIRHAESAPGINQPRDEFRRQFNLPHLDGLDGNGGEITLSGTGQCEKLCGEFSRKYDIFPWEVGAATSEHLRTQQTAMYAGFSHIKSYASLNEIKHGVPRNELEDMLKEGYVPPQARIAAENLLENPPKHLVWITHGLVIAGLRAALGIKADNLRPDHCELIELPIRLFESNRTAQLVE